MSTHASHCVLIVAWHFSICVDVTNEAVYELVAEPTQEQQAGEPQAEVAVKPIPEEVANPAVRIDGPRGGVNWAFFNF